MYKTRERLQNIYLKISYIEDIVNESGNITKSLNDEKKSRPAILMHLASIAEQFDKLSKAGEFDILNEFDKRDLKGTYDVRNYIVHDYEGINLSIIENIIRYKLPEMKKILEILLKN